MLRSLTIALPDNMVQNKDIIMTLNLYEKWDKATLTAHLISASCAKNFGDWNSLALCLFTESEGTNKLISDCGNELSTPSTSTEALEVTEVKVFAKKA